MSEITAHQQATPPSPDRMQELDFFIGGWDAPGKFHDTPFARGKDIHMRLETSSDDGGHWLMVRTVELPTPQNPRPLTARYLWGYDPAGGEFVADWFDSNGGRARQRSSGWVGHQLVFLGEMTMSGHTVPLRDTFVRHGDNAYHHLGELDLGGGWIPVDEEDAVRDPSSS